ncbi:hypothetical protein [Prevotella ihumii]|uniref:hypothetical protein n=1 Tax=Prevotella ihumii TaxID=1917878 RepID=UPI0009826683|nr:hypothetical protein [Prevotella ihumii]
MKNLLLTIALMLATVSMQAQKISYIETTKSWYYVYDDNGKKIKTISTSAGELKGYSVNFYVVQQGSWIYTFEPAGKKLHAFLLLLLVKSFLWLVTPSPHGRCMDLHLEQGREEVEYPRCQIIFSRFYKLFTGCASYRHTLLLSLPPLSHRSIVWKQRK